MEKALQGIIEQSTVSEANIFSMSNDTFIVKNPV